GSLVAGVTNRSGHAPRKLALNVKAPLPDLTVFVIWRRIEDVNGTNHSSARGSGEEGVVEGQDWRRRSVLESGDIYGAAVGGVDRNGLTSDISGLVDLAAGLRRHQGE